MPKEDSIPVAGIIEGFLLIPATTQTRSMFMFESRTSRIMESNLSAVILHGLASRGIQLAPLQKTG